jgi:solute carrier family 25 phosphate transporter 3
MGGDKHDLNYYLMCMTGGLMACGLTHTAIVSLDVTKCKKQIDKNFCKTMIEGLKKVKAAGQLTLGW